LKLFVVLTFVISFPLSAILDKALGQEVGNFYSKNRMKRLFQSYEKEKHLDPSTSKWLANALDFREKDASLVMTLLADIFMLDADSEINRDLLKRIYMAGHSRIPVYRGRRENIVGILMTRDLILINPEKLRISISQIQSILIRNVVTIDSKTKLGPILSFFKKGQSHMAIVTNVVEHVS
jgi:metal transporter CNNM